MTGTPRRRFASRKGARRSLALGAVALVTLGGLAAGAAAQLPSTTDPRVGLATGLNDAGVASRGVELRAHRDKPAGLFNPANAHDFGYFNSDLAIQGDHAYVGGFRGFHAWNIADPDNPTLVSAVVCPGGQGDPSLWGNLLFMSYENAARTDCGTQAETADTAFRGVRIFDISNPAAPVQVAAVQTCRGSHTHTLVPDPGDDSRIYVYNSGTSGVRSATHTGRPANCFENGTPAPNASRWSIDVIEVPLAAPQNAAIVNQPRLFQDPNTGAINGLQNTPPAPNHPSGIPWSPQPVTDACHDITAYPEIGLAAGACEGNGILIDISDPRNPTRVAAAADPNFAYWHSATFSNDGTKVVYTDEWGGGTAARCRATDQLNWGANAIFDVVKTKVGKGRNATWSYSLAFKSYYKMPAAQSTAENCVAHNGNLIPVPGRDLLSQAWYQGGHSVMDFTDSANPKEVAYYDRGPASPTFNFAGFWSTYYYNGNTYATELARGFDVFRHTPTSDISANELQAASEPQTDRLNAQLQSRIEWAPSFAVVRSHLDQLVRAGAIDAKTLAKVEKHLGKAETSPGKAKGEVKAAEHALSKKNDAYDALREALHDLHKAL